MKVKEILNLTSKELENKMTAEEYDRMKTLNIEHVWQLLDLMQDSARLSGQNDDEEHVTISAYLDYLEDMKS